MLLPVVPPVVWTRLAFLGGFGASGGCLHFPFRDLGFVSVVCCCVLDRALADVPGEIQADLLRVCGGEDSGRLGVAAERVRRSVIAF